METILHPKFLECLLDFLPLIAAVKYHYVHMVPYNLAQIPHALLFLMKMPIPYVFLQPYAVLNLAPLSIS